VWVTPSIAASAVCVFAFFGLWQLLIILPQTLSLLLFVILYGVLEGAARRRWLLLLLWARRQPVRACRTSGKISCR